MMTCRLTAQDVIKCDYVTQLCVKCQADLSSVSAKS